MKKFLILLHIIPFFLYSQQWVDMMQDPSINFYETQKEFEAYWNNRNIEKGKGWKQFKRWENFMKPRVFPDGIQHQDKLYKQFNTSNQNNFNTLSTNIWTQVGPTNVPLESSGRKRGIGRVNTIAFHPTNADIIYIGAPAGGFWKSVNGGQSWNTTTDFLTNLGVSDIAINPNNTNEIYIITGDRDGGDTYSYGLMKSLDGGGTFTTTGLSFNITGYYRGNRVLINPVNTDLIIVATSNGIYRSTNAGQTFSHTFSNINITDIEFHSTNSNIIYAASKGNTSIYKSIDGGINWQQAGSGLPSSNNVVRACVAVTPDNPSVVYALFGDNNNGFYGLYKSNNEGSTWSQQANTPNLLGWSSTGSDSDGQAWYDLALAVDPNDEMTLFVGGVNCWKSTDGGFSWNINTHWYGANGTEYKHADIHMLKYNLIDNKLYSGNDGGLYYSDNGINWEDISDGLEISQFYSIGVSQTVQDKVIAGSQDNGTLLKEPSNWSAVIGGDGMECIIDYTNANIMYGALYYGDIKKSTNGGNSFSSIGPANNGAWETPYELDKNNPNIMYAGYDELYKTTDGGNNWSIITNGQTNGSKIDEIALSSSNSDVIYFTNDNEIYKTNNGGISWSQINNNLPNRYVSYIIVHPNDENKVWVTFSGYGSGQKVYKTNNGGANWVNISGSLPNLPVNCIELDKNDSLESIYIGTDIGVYRSDSTLNDWNLFNNNSLPNVIVNELEIQYQSNKLVAATYGRGLWNVNLEITSPPIANFSYSDSIFCNTPAEVSFSNNSYYSTSYYWDFGDGNYSTLSNPTHIYNSFGVFNVKLIATGPLGADTIVYQQIINIDPNNPCIITLPDDGSGYTQNSCTGTLYDAGGPNGNYFDNSNSWITIAPAGSNQITLDFTTFDIEAPSSQSYCNWDYLEIFDGPDTSSVSLGQYCNTLTGSPGNIISSGGSITIYLHSDGAVNGTGFSANWSCNFPSAPPVTLFEVGDTLSCSKTILFTDLSTNGPTSWLWDFGDGNTSGLQNPIHTYSSAGTYTVKLTTSNQFGSDSLILNNIISIIDIDIQANNVYGCSNNSLTISASSNDGVIKWFSDSLLLNHLYTGGIYSTPILNNSATYYLQSTYNFPSIFGGELDNTFNTGGFFNGDQHLNFNANEACVIKSALIYSEAANVVTFELRDSFGTVLEDTTLSLVSGQQRINLDFDVSIGIDYQLGVSQGALQNTGLYRNNSGASYPYNIGSSITITSSSANSSPYGYYYFYYDIEIEKQCKSDIVSVDAIVNNEFSASQNVSICQGENFIIGNNSYTSSGLYTDTLSSILGCDSIITTNLLVEELTVSIDNNNNTLFINILNLDPPYNVLWNTNETTDSIIPISNGLYWCIVTDSNGCTDSVTYFVEFASAIDYNTQKFDIYPNPTNNNVYIKVNQLHMGEIRVFNSLGKIIFSSNLSNYQVNDIVTVDLSKYSKGIYIANISTDRFVVNKKIVLE